MPKIPKKEKVGTDAIARNTPPRKESRDKISKHQAKQEKIIEDTFKEKSKKVKEKKIKKEMSPVTKEKAIKRKPGRPKKDENTALNIDDFTAKLDDLEKSIREEENDNKDGDEEDSER